MNDEEIRERLTAVFRSVFDDESIEVNSTTTAQDVEGWDSLAHIQLVVAIEKEFRVRFTMLEVKRLKNVGDLFNLVQTKVG
jgi:acyl carrier protein